MGYGGKDAVVSPAGWEGLWLDAVQGLVLRTTADASGVSLRYATTPSTLSVGPDGIAQGGGVSLQHDGGTLVMRREAENLTVTARAMVPVEVADGQALAGRYWSDELEAGLDIETWGGATFPGFDGMLGAGPVERMYSVACDIWAITTRRSMDASPPGDWTVQVRRAEDGAVIGLTLGCWLARRIEYRRVA